MVDGVLGEQILDGLAEMDYDGNIEQSMANFSKMLKTYLDKYGDDDSIKVDIYPDPPF